MVSLPTARLPAGMVTVALPCASAVAAEVYAPLVKVTVPVGDGVLVTFTVTTSVSTVWIDVLAVDTLIVGVALVTVMGPELEVAVT
jgi:hypothetical protein